MSHSFIDYPSSGPDQGIVKDLSPAADPGTAADAVLLSIKRLYQRLPSPAARRRGILPGPSIATDCKWYDNSLSDGTATSRTYFGKHTISKAATGLRLVYCNGYNDEANASPNSITIKASVDPVAGGSTPVPVFFRGQRSATIDAGGFVVSDPIGVDVVAGTVIGSRTCVSVATSGQKWPVGYNASFVTGMGGATGDQTDSGTPTSSFEPRYGPAAICGDVYGTTVLVAGVGDSIMGGRNARASTGAYGVSPLELALGGNTPYVVISCSGEKVQTFITGAGHRLRGQIASGCTHAVVEYGRNDLNAGRSASQVLADLNTLWTLLASWGLKVYQTTITPHTTSTDSWATVANQTVFNSSYEAQRVLLNASIRAVPSPLTGILELADAMESSRDSGKWKANYTGDGLHPGDGNNYLSAPLTAMAAVFSSSTFTLV